MEQTNLPRGYDGSKTKITLYELQIGYSEKRGVSMVTIWSLEIKPVGVPNMWKENITGPALFQNDDSTCHQQQLFMAWSNHGLQVENKEKERDHWKPNWNQDCLSTLLHKKRPTYFG